MELLIVQSFTHSIFALRGTFKDHVDDYRISNQYAENPGSKFIELAGTPQRIEDFC
jgi:hypothetical protein